MKILTNTQYEAIVDLVRDLQKENKTLKRERDLAQRDLRDLQNFIMNFVVGRSKEIDFPNSSSEVKNEDFQMRKWF